MLSLVVVFAMGLSSYFLKDAFQKENVTELSSYAGEQKNICSITINSDDEIKSFKQKLAGDNRFKFTELAVGDERWFERACAQDIQCDVLVISGHFGGTFFGESGYHLSLSELETKSCSRKCTGILEKPKEVYLFGCNTLAGKEPDARTPEEYLQVLLADGLERSFAERVVEARYGPSGEKNISRMERSFPGVPAIYGFCEKAPLGKESGPIVKNYLSTVSDGYFDQLNKLEHVQKTMQPYSSDTLSKLTNTNLASRFTAIGRCFKQTNGIGTDNDVANRICSVRNTNNTIEARAADLDYLLRSKQNLGYIELCNDFFNEMSKVKLTAAQQQAIAQIKNNDSLKNDLAGLIDKVTFFLAYDYATLGVQLGLPVTQVSPTVSKSFIEMVTKGLTQEEVNLMINSDFRNPFKNLIRIDYASVDTAKTWENGNSIEAIGLTGTKDSQIISRLQNLLSTAPTTIKRQLLKALTRLEAVTASLKKPLIEMLYETDYDIRANSVQALEKIQTYDEQIVNEMIALMNREQNGWVLKKASLYFVGVPFDTPAIQEHLTKSLQHSSSEVRQYTAQALGNRNLKDRFVFEGLFQCLADKNAAVHDNCRYGLKRNSAKIPKDIATNIQSQYPQDYSYIMNTK